jgi:hypothetical protein
VTGKIAKWKERRRFGGILIVGMGIKPPASKRGDSVSFLSLGPIQVQTGAMQENRARQRGGAGCETQS